MDSPWTGRGSAATATRILRGQDAAAPQAEPAIALSATVPSLTARTGDAAAAARGDAGAWLTLRGRDVAASSDADGHYACAAAVACLSTFGEHFCELRGAAVTGASAAAVGARAIWPSRCFGRSVERASS